jgi:cell pole-organizing protein PopZ
MPMQPGQKKENTVEDQVQLPEGLVSKVARNEIANTVGALVHSISQERAVSVSRGGVTIEDIVREEIKPVLKAWLDTHLPTLVERIVRAEIGRVIDRTQA